MISNELFSFLKYLLPPLAPALILGGFVLFVVYTSKPLATPAAPPLPAPDAVVRLAFTPDTIQPTEPASTEAHWD